MKAVPHDYETDLLRADLRKSLRDLYINPLGISPNPDGSLHCVEAVAENTNQGCMLRLRVITNNGRGVRVTVPCNSEYEYKRFLLLRDRIRNTDSVLVNFDALRVSTSSHGFGELYLFAKDYTAIVSDEDGSNLEF